MDTASPEGMERRRAQLERLKEQRIYKAYQRACKNNDYFKMKMIAAFLQSRYGWDADYIPGMDDGEYKPH